MPVLMSVKWTVKKLPIVNVLIVENALKSALQKLSTLNKSSKEVSL